MTKNDTLFVTELDLTRGVDYRAAPGTKGIALLLMHEMPSERALVQLLGRVGRFNEFCQRFRWVELPSLVSEKKVEQLNRSIAA